VKRIEIMNGIVPQAPQAPQAPVNNGVALPNNDVPRARGIFALDINTPWFNFGVEVNAFDAGDRMAAVVGGVRLRRRDGGLVNYGVGIIL
jgi:hypothetical protein